MVLLIISVGILLLALMPVLSFWLDFELFGTPHISILPEKSEKEKKE